MIPFEFLHHPTIQAQLPLVFPNGARWETFHARCNGCNNAIPDESFRGSISYQKNTFIIDALAHCDKCQLFMPIRYRLHPDMSMTGMDRDGRWMRWSPIRNTLN